MSGNAFNLFSLPDIAIKEIFSYLSYDEVSRYRVVSRDFNAVGKEVLSKGLIKVEKFHNMCLKEVRVQLPRRESERRSHPLARHVDVLMAIETRISMLSMTYSKYIDSGLTCFIPGKVLDEIYRVLRLVRATECPPRPHEILQELRDISSMAMEHFDDKIAPELKQKLNPGNTAAGLLIVKQARRHSYILQPNTHPVRLAQATPAPEQTQEMDDMKANIKKAKVSSTAMKKDIKALKSKVRRQSRVIENQRTKIIENTTKIAEQGTQLAELRRLIEEYGLKVASQSHSSSTKTMPSTSSYSDKEPTDVKRTLHDSPKGPPEKRKRKR